MITETAYAKINLTLSVGGKRADGYHLIDSVMHSISLHDRITLEKADDISLTVTKGEAPLGRDNLMVRAAELFFEETAVKGGVRMTLEKHIPAEAGMGGGSSDAAAVLRGLERLYQTGRSLKDLAAMSAGLGADIPFCVIGGACRCEGIGEKLTKLIPWEGLPLLIIRPQTAESTAAAYRMIDRMKKHLINTTSACVKALEEKRRDLLAASLCNDFEPALFCENEILRNTAARLASLCRPALMTGSGSAFFVLLESKEEGKKLLEKLRSENPGWFVEMGETVGVVSR